MGTTSIIALFIRYAKSRLFSTTGSYGSQGPEFCTPAAVLNGSCTLLWGSGLQGCSRDARCSPQETVDAVSGSEIRGSAPLSATVSDIYSKLRKSNMDQVEKKQHGVCLSGFEQHRSGRGPRTLHSPRNVCGDGPEFCLRGKGGGWVGLWGDPPPPSGDPELLEAPKKFFGLN